MAFAAFSFGKAEDLVPETVTGLKTQEGANAIAGRWIEEANPSARLFRVSPFIEKTYYYKEMPEAAKAVVEHVLFSKAQVVNRFSGEKEIVGLIYVADDDHYYIVPGKDLKTIYATVLREGSLYLLDPHPVDLNPLSVN
jgi:hypothetical protein